MPLPRVGVTLDLHIDMRSTAAGGRQSPIADGYRPVCVIDGPNGEAMIGLCELQLNHPVSPGNSGIGRLSFDISVSEQIRGLLHVGSRFALAEGPRRIAEAEVRGISR